MFIFLFIVRCFLQYVQYFCLFDVFLQYVQYFCLFGGLVVKEPFSVVLSLCSVIIHIMFRIIIFMFGVQDSILRGFVFACGDHGIIFCD